MLWDCVLALCETSAMALALANAKFNSWLAWDNFKQKRANLIILEVKNKIIITFHSLTPLYNSSPFASLSRICFCASLAKLKARSALVVAPSSHDKPPQKPQPAPPQSLLQVSPPLSQIYKKNICIIRSYYIVYIHINFTLFMFLHHTCWFNLGISWFNLFTSLFNFSNVSSLSLIPWLKEFTFRPKNNSVLLHWCSASDSNLSCTLSSIFNVFDFSYASLVKFKAPLKSIYFKYNIIVFSKNIIWFLN